MSEKFRNLLFSIGALSVLTGAALRITDLSFASLLFAIGASGIAISRLTFRYEGKNIRLKRLYGMQKLSSLLMIYTSYMIFKPNFEWVVFLMISAILELYSSFVIDREQKGGSK